MSVTLRKGTDADAEMIVGYLKKLAEYEKLGDMCSITPEALIKLMNEENGLHTVIAERSGRHDDLVRLQDSNVFGKTCILY